MGKLVFRVASDWQEVVRLRTEIEKLKQTLLSMDSTQSPDTFKKLNIQLGENTKKMNILISDAAKAGATMENDFKKGIYDGEKAVNSLSEEIIKQKNIIRETQNDVSMLTEQYNKLGKYDPKRQSLSDELNRAKAALGEQKYALGELQSQQALARLSTKALKDEYALFKDESKAVINVNEGVGVSFKKTLAAIGGIAMLKQVASNVVSTAGMFQKYESVLTNALNGSSEKAKTYLSDINSFAAKTNFQLNELTDDFIKFVNRGVTPSMDAMKKMGDFTNTVAKPFDQLTEAILDINNSERWKEFGVRVQTEGDKVKLSFRDMTVECDRTVESVMKAVEQFGSIKGVEGSTEAISKTIEGQMSNLEDTITTALAEIGLANQGLISGSISAVDTVVKNYDIIGKSVLALIEIYGVYRAGLLINTIVEQGSVKSIWAKITATKAATIAQVAYNKVLAMNPYVAVGMAVVSLGVAVYTLADHTTYAEKTVRTAAESMEQMKNASESLKNKISELLSVIRDETSTQYQKADAYLKLQGILPEVFKNMDIEKIKLMDQLSLLKQINKAADRREIVGAKTSVVLAQKEVDKINALIAADSKRGTYSGQYEIQLSDAKSKLEAAKKVVADIEKIQAEASKQKEKDDKKVIIKNKEHWTNQKKDAEEALDSIASSQRKMMNAGQFKGIPQDIIDKYKQAIKLKAEAEKELKVYDSSSKQENQADKLRKEQEKLNEQLLSLRRKNQQDEINLMEDGTEKKLRQINLDYQKETDAIKKQRKEWEDAQGGKLTEEQTLVIDLRKELAGKKKDSDTSKVHEEEVKEYQKLLSSYQDYLTKRKNAEDKFNADRKKLKDGGASDAQINELEYQRDETLKSIDNEFAMREDSFKAWTDNIANLSLEKLRELLVQAERELERSEFLNPNDPKLAGQRAKVTSLKNTISEKSEKTNTSPNKRSQKEWQDLYNTLSKVERQFDEIGNTVGGTAGEIISAAGGIATSTLQMIDGIVTLANGSSEAMSGTAQAASASIQAVEKASVILAIIGAALQIATKLASLFGNSSMEYYESLKDELGAINEIYGDIIEKSKEKIVFGGGFAALESYREANDLLERQIENYRKLAEAGGDARKTGSHSYAYRANERLSGRSASGKSGVEAGKGRFEDISEVLGKNITKVQDLYNLTGEELYLVQTKFPEAWSKIPEEITDSLQAIIDCREESEKLRDALNEAITGVSFDSFYNEFIDMLSDMDMSAEDMAENFGEYLRKSILAAMVAKNFQEDINKLYDKWVAAGEEDSLGGMTITEDEARDIQDGYKKLVDAMVQARDNMGQAFGWDSSATSQDSSSRGFQTMSQDTGEELNGRFTALQVAGEEIKNQNVIQSQSLNLLTARADAILSMNTETRNIADDTRDLIAQSYLELVQISENTGNSAKYLKDIKADIAEVKKNTSKL
ncbi:hypothetical protein [uncultured Bacteroides sp.]|uniref:hypothetical protein n=1 Tax=uncultured Bacteroides sp. TaxID=162156 RepID=UPI002600E008|nr:hypothetical protein [uncultured Bacteroides sp.]